jgi:solute carrier family 35, member F5
VISRSDHEDPLQSVPRLSGITIIWLFTTIMRPSYAIGLFFIACVTIIWSLASIVVQFLYTDEKFNSPFLLTYIGTTLFTLFLPTRLLWERLNCGVLENDIFPWKAETTYETIPAVMMEASFDKTLDRTIDRTIDKTLDRGLEHEELFHNNNDDDDPMPDMTASSQPKVPSDYTLMSHQEHLMIALKIAPIWFIGNWAYNASLAYTSITSSTVLASTGSVFTFLFAVSWGDEQFTHLKLLGVLLGVTGSILTGWHDIQSFQTAHDVDYSNSTLTLTSLTPNDHFELQAPVNPWESHAIWGDILGLLSAIGYGTYTVMIRLFCPRDERCMSMQLLLGYIGLLNAVALFPMALYVLFFQTNAQRLTVIVLGYLVAQGLLDNVLSDYLWARAVLLTSATVATVGLGLTIPLAFVSDWILGNMQESSILSVLGAISVLVGFVVVNVESDACE